MADLDVQLITTAGLDPTFGAATAAGDQFINNGRTFLRVDNGSGGSINVTIDSKVTCDQGSTHDVVVAVGNGDVIDIGPFPTDRFNDHTTGKADVTYSDDTSVTVAVISI